MCVRGVTVSVRAENGVRVYTLCLEHLECSPGTDAIRVRLYAEPEGGYCAVLGCELLSCETEHSSTDGYKTRSSPYTAHTLQ